MATKRSATKSTGARKAGTGREKKPHGDVLGISRARVSAPLPRATANSSTRKRRERASTASTRPAPKPARVVGGVRGRGR